jgi:hypothetical protein
MSAKGGYLYPETVREFHDETLPKEGAKTAHCFEMVRVWSDVRDTASTAFQGFLNLAFSSCYLERFWASNINF